jgi:NADH:ubiquinone reductase (H+-translocating)
MPRRVVVLGAGYAGIVVSQWLGKRAAKHNLDITLVDCNDYLLLQPFIHRTAFGNVEPSAATIPVSRLMGSLPVRFVQATVTGFDPRDHTVQTTKGTLQYDRLVIALGSETLFFGIPGLRERAFTLKSQRDVWRARRHVCNVFEQAATASGGEREALLHIVIGGGGYTGVEIACELGDTLPILARRYGIDPGEARVSVCEALPTILQGFPPEHARVASEAMRKKGVDLLLGQPVVRVDDDGVTLQSGARLRTRTLVWVAGVTSNKIVASSPLKKGAGQRAIVNPFLQSVDYSSIYVLGDSALALDPETGKPVPASGQLAMLEGEAAARNILLEDEAKGIPFRPHELGVLVTTGRRSAVGDAFGITVRGYVAHIVKQGAESRYVLKAGGVLLAAQKFFMPRRPFSCKGEGGDEEQGCV